MRLRAIFVHMSLSEGNYVSDVRTEGDGDFYVQIAAFGHLDIDDDNIVRTIG